MPKYVYECTTCGCVYDVRHSMNEREEDCRHCDDGKVRKVISDFTSITKTNSEQKKEIGSEVKEFIETTKKEIKEERDILSSRIIKWYMDWL